MSCPIRQESCSQWFYEFHFKESLLLWTLCILVWLRIVLNAQFQFGIAFFIHLTCLIHHFVNWKST